MNPQETEKMTRFLRSLRDELGITILLIEHDPGFARYVGEMLGQARELAAEVRYAGDLGSALSEIQARRLDAVLA